MYSVHLPQPNGITLGTGLIAKQLGFYESTMDKI